MAKIGDKHAMEIAKEYIEEMLGIETEEEVMNNLRRKTNLSYRTLQGIFSEVLSEKYEESKIKVMERMERAKKEEKIIGEDRCKGRKRETFKIDDSKLYGRIGN